MIDKIWQDSGLKDVVWRKQIFDNDDFAISECRLRLIFTFFKQYLLLAFKTEMALWGYKNIKADVGLSLLSE